MRGITRMGACAAGIPRGSISWARRRSCFARCRLILSGPGASARRREDSRAPRGVGGGRAMREVR
eukprot:3872128-Pyramimonas_sp.AAC.1